MIGALLLQVVLIFLNATFASAEIAVISMNETRLRKLTADGDKRAVKLSAGSKAYCHEKGGFHGAVHVGHALWSVQGICAAGISLDSIHEPDPEADGY